MIPTSYDGTLLALLSLPLNQYPQPGRIRMMNRKYLCGNFAKTFVLYGGRARKCANSYNSFSAVFIQQRCGSLAKGVRVCICGGN